MGFAFISYSHKDREYVQKLHHALEQEGFEVWVDEHIDYGEAWIREVQQRVDECDAFIVVISRYAETSEWVQNELARAKRKKKPIFPLLMEGEPWLSFEAIQYEDVSGGELPPLKFYERLAEKTTRQIIKSTYIPDLEQAQAYYDQGRKLAQQNRFEAAIVSYQQAIAQNPNYVHAWCNLGVLLQELKRTGEAEKAFRQAVRLDPNDAQSYFYLGVLLSKQNRIRDNRLGDNLTGSDSPPGPQAEATVESLLQMIRTNPADHISWHNLRVMLMEQKLYPEAEQLFHREISKNPANAEAYNDLGQVLAEMNRSDEAESAYRKAFELDPDHATACYNLGMLLQIKNRKN